MIPSLAILSIETPRWRIPQLWLPLFLLWIPLLLISPLILLVLGGLCIAGRLSLWRAFAVFWSILCSLPGTQVRVCTDGNNIQVRIL